MFLKSHLLFATIKNFKKDSMFLTVNSLDLIYPFEDSTPTF
jgi:hypothetical protein